jgi:predicted outer membrane protein
MRSRTYTAVATTLLAATTLAYSGCSAQDRGQMRAQKSGMEMSAERGAVDKVIADWPERPRFGANAMLAKYGSPQEVTSEKLIWHNQGPYKRIMVTREEIPHDFPKPHMDFLEHTISYDVPADKVGDLVAFDGSSTINRTAGELSARCDLEGHNILTLNLDHDIVTGKKTVEEARKSFGENVVADVMGKHPPYVEALQFKPASETAARFADTPVIPGSPVRATKAAGSEKGDAEVLAFVIAVDDNEVLAATEAQKKKLSPDVMAYAKMLHTEHGKHQGEAMKLGQQIGVTPVDTAAVDKLRVKGAGALAALLPLDGKEFEKAYLAAMVKDHTEVLAMIDNQLLKAAENDAVKKHLTATRSHIASHLEQAKNLTDGSNR